MTAGLVAGLPRTLRIGTRRSALALAQSGQVADRLGGMLGCEVELVEVATQGDLDPRALTAIGGAGVFVVALRSALLGAEVDIAVHSLKDLPTAAPEGLVLAAVPVREDPRDVLVASVPLAELPAGARVGTGAPRRAAQLAALRPDLEIVPVRGNVDTRIAKVARGELDGVVLARAGLARLGRLAEIVQTFEADELLAAPGQGALAIECRAADTALAAAVAAALDDPVTRACVIAERAVLAELQAGCSAPVAALAEPEGAGLRLRAAVGDPGGAAVRAGSISADRTISVADALGRTVARELLAAGAAGLMDRTGTDSPHPGAQGDRARWNR